MSSSNPQMLRARSSQDLRQKAQAQANRAALEQAISARATREGYNPNNTAQKETIGNAHKALFGNVTFSQVYYGVLTIFLLKKGRDKRVQMGRHAKAKNPNPKKVLEDAAPILAGKAPGNEDKVMEAIEKLLEECGVKLE